MVRALSNDKHGVQLLSVTNEAVGQPKAEVTTGESIAALVVRECDTAAGAL